METFTTALNDLIGSKRADVDRMIQVMLNLLSNAAKFCDASAGRITVSLATRRNLRGRREVRVEVRDNGPGIPADERASVFDKFHQVRDTATGKPQGSGLGLYITRQIVERSGGRIWIEPPPSGQHGARFCFALPVMAADGAAAQHTLVSSA